MRKMFAAIVAIFMAISLSLGVASASVVAPQAKAVKTVRTMANGQTVQTFKYGTEPDQVGDVYYDTDWAAGSHPAIVVIHGGWWHNATRQASNATSQKWLDAGFVVFNIDYRVAADHPAYAGSGETGMILGQRWPAQRQDVARANDWLRANASQFGTASDRIGAYGFSAGGHLAHKVANFYGTSKFKASASVSAILQPTRTAEIVLNGSYAGDSSSYTLGKSFGYMTSLIGCSYEPDWSDCGAKWRSIKLETDFGPTKPPMYVVKGDSDDVEPFVALQSLKYWADQADQSIITVGVTDRGHDEYMVTGTGSADVARWNALVSWMKSKTQ